MENTHTTETARACQKSETITMTPRQQREHLFAIREQDAPSPYVLAHARVAPVDEDELHAATEKAYAEALASLCNMREMLAHYAPVSPATSEHLAEVRRFARLVKDVEGLL